MSLNPDAIERALYAGPALFRAGSHSGLCKSRHQRHHQGQVFQLRRRYPGRDLPHSPVNLAQKHLKSCAAPTQGWWSSMKNS